MAKQVSIVVNTEILRNWIKNSLLYNTKQNCVAHECFQCTKFCCDHLPFVVDVSGSHTPPPPHSWPCAAFPGQRLDECFFSPSPNIPRHVRCTSALSLNPPPMALGPNHMVQLVECYKEGLALVIIWWIFLRKEVCYDDITTNHLGNTLH